MTYVAEFLGIGSLSAEYGYKTNCMICLNRYELGLANSILITQHSFLSTILLALGYGVLSPFDRLR